MVAGGPAPSNALRTQASRAPGDGCRRMGERLQRAECNVDMDGPVAHGPHSPPASVHIHDWTPPLMTSDLQSTIVAAWVRREDIGPSTEGPVREAVEARTMPDRRAQQPPRHDSDAVPREGQSAARPDDRMRPPV